MKLCAVDLAAIAVEMAASAPARVGALVLSAWLGNASAHRRRYATLVEEAAA